MYDKFLILVGHLQWVIFDPHINFERQDQKKYRTFARG
jgi:hypothetical protein